MQITKEEAIRLKPARGRVLVEVPNIMSEQVELNGAIINVRAISDEARVDMGSRSGIVHSVSDYADVPALCYCWDGPVEIQKGDEVYFSHDAIAKAATVQNDENYYYTFEDDGKQRCLLVVPYKEIIMRIRGEEVFSLNDYVIVSKVMKPKPTFLIMPDEYEENIFLIEHAPTGNIVYDWREGYFKSGWKAQPVKNNMKVKTKNNKPVKLEYKYKQSLEKELYYFQTHQIIAEVDGE